MASINDKRLVLLVTCMAAFTTPFLSSSVNIAIKTINSDFGFPDQALLNWVVLGFMLSAAIFVVPFGRIADVFGRKLVFVLGLTVIVLSSIACALSTSIEMLIAARLVEGFGSAMIFGTQVAILTSVYPAKERGKVLGINVAITYVGLSLGPTLGGFLTYYGQSFGSWRLIYAGMAAYALIIVLLSQWKIKEEWRCAETEPFDLAGSALYGATLLAMMLGLAFVQTVPGIGALLLSLLLAAAFFWWELRNRNPVLKVSVFRNNTVFMFSNLAALINYSATAAVAFMLSDYLQFLRGNSALVAGLILIAQPIVMAIFSPLTGRLSDRVEPRIVASAGMGLCVIGLVLFALITPGTPIEMIIAGLMFLGLGFALFSSPNTNAIMSSVDRCDYGVASGMVSEMRLIGQMLSLGVMNLVFTVIMGHISITPDVYPQLMQSIQIMFVLMAALCIVGVFFSLARGNLQRAPVKAPTIAQAAKKP